MRQVALWGVVLASVVTGGEVSANFWTGNTLYSWCSDSGGRNACEGYVMGVVDAAYTGDRLWRAEAGWRWCLPSGVSGTQLTDSVVLFLKENPEKRHMTAASLVAGAIAERFPCSD